MIGSVRFTSRAARQITAALDWWNDNRADAPTLLADELDRAIALVTRFPESGIPALTPRLRPIRRVILRRSRYALFYRLHDGAIEVVAVWHQERGSSPDIR